MVAVSFIQKQLGVDITWLEWFKAAAPFSAIMSVVLYFVLMKMMPPETEEIAGGRDAVAKALSELGPMRAEEKRLLAVSVILLFFWTTEKVLHPFDTSSTTIAAITFMLLPVVGVISSRATPGADPVGHGRALRRRHRLGSALLTTKAAPWLAKLIVAQFGSRPPRPS